MCNRSYLGTCTCIIYKKYNKLYNGNLCYSYMYVESTRKDTGGSLLDLTLSIPSLLNVCTGTYIYKLELSIDQIECEVSFQ